MSDGARKKSHKKLFSFSGKKHKKHITKQDNHKKYLTKQDQHKKYLNEKAVKKNDSFTDFEQFISNNKKGDFANIDRFNPNKAPVKRDKLSDIDTAHDQKFAKIIASALAKNRDGNSKNDNFEINPQFLSNFIGAELSGLVSGFSNDFFSDI